MNLASLAALAATGSVDNGRQLYQSACLQCHGALRPNISPMLAADNPARIREAINPLSLMSTLSYLSNEDLLDIASYIARPGSNDTDRLFDWAEQQGFPDALGKSANATQEYGGYRYRYYPSARLFLGTRNGEVVMLGEGSTVPALLGTMRQYLRQMPPGR
ncbi:cytochrome c [Chitinimonas sp.]|uniref:c-type cytochrome n=1 Tax=Chitinimonas sp. TaxID=1934313 RepID=UPI0035AFE437